MKKTLLAAALLTGFAGAASAQSSVTMYGILDGGLRYQNWNLSSGPFAKVDVSTSSIAVISGGQSTSRFGVKGVEDLGSGNQAVFTLEAQVGVNAGSSSGDTWSRQSTVGLRNNAWGQFDIGRQLVLASKFAGVTDYAFANTTPISNSSTSMGIVTYRQSNMLMYQSPSISGFKVGAQYSFNTGLATGRQLATGASAADTATAGNAFQTGNNMRNIAGAVSYTNGGLYVAGVYDQFTPADNTLAGQNGTKVTSWIIAGGYDAKVVKIGAAYNQVRGGLINGASTSTVSGDIINPFNQGGIVFAEGAGTNGWNINLTAPVGASGTLLASYNGVSATGVVADVGGATTAAYGLGYSHAFTKRTNVYAMYAYVNNYLNIAGLSGNTGVVGLRHAF